VNPPAEGQPVGAGAIAAACFVAFGVLGSYGFTRPVVDSWFVGAHGKEGLPLAWVLVAVGATLAVGAYNRFATHIPLRRLFRWVVVLSALPLALLLPARSAELPGVHYALYVWKDVHIVLLVEMFWSISNSVFDLKRARRTYGLFLVCGTLGSMVGEKSVEHFAVELGSGTLVLAAFPLLALAWLAVRGMPFVAPRPELADKKPDIRENLQVLQNSRYLILMLVLVATTQIVINLVDYVFAGYVQDTFGRSDEASAFYGSTYFLIDATSLGLQVVAGAIVRVAGVGGTLLLVPLLLGGTVILAITTGSAAWMKTMKVASKSLDYSIFRAAKEMLYLPLDYAEKTQGKALVDMLTYRVAKAFTGLLLKGSQVLVPAGAAAPMALVGLGVWIAVVWPITRRYRERTAEG
jgi:AAA family ATP:ADP antiporter